jgi:hypothetical protein
MCIVLYIHILWGELCTENWHLGRMENIFSGMHENWNRNAGDWELQKCGSISFSCLWNVTLMCFRVLDWGSMNLTAPLYSLFLGTQLLNTKSRLNTIKPEHRRSPASTRIRLKILPYLCRSRGPALVFPACIQVREFVCYKSWDSLSVWCRKITC